MGKPLTGDQGERFLRSTESLALVMHEVGIPALMITFADGQAEISWAESLESDGPDRCAMRPIDDLRRYEDIVVETPPR